MMSSTIDRMITAEMKKSRTFSVCHIQAFIRFYHMTSESANPLLNPPPPSGQEILVLATH